MQIQSDSLRHLCTLCLFILVAGSTASVLAHGGPPSALGLVAANPNAEVTLLNEGIALKRPEGWSYLCPSLWGELNLASGKFPLARSADGVATYLPGGADLFVLTDGRLVAQQRPEYRRDLVIALANDAQYVYGLHLTAEQSTTEVVRLNAQGDPGFFSSQEYWSAITVDEQAVYVASVNRELLTVAKIDKQGAELERATAMLPIALYELTLHALGTRLYVTGSGDTGSIAGYLEGGAWTEVVQDPLPIVGPEISADGTVWIAVAGALARLKDDGAIEPVGETRFIKCLERWNDRHYACVDYDLHELTADGIGERWFEMQGILSTDPKMITADAKESCEQQWLIYKIDAMRTGLVFNEWPVQPGSEAAAGASGSAAAPVAGMGAAGSGATAAASATATAGAGPDVMAGGASEPTSSGGCSCTVVSASPRRGAFALLFLAMVAVWARRRARRS